MNMKQAAALPCPFCGSPARITQRDGDAYCPNSACWLGDSKHVVPIKEWNGRALSSQATPAPEPPVAWRWKREDGAWAFTYSISMKAMHEARGVNLEPLYSHPLQPAAQGNEGSMSHVPYAYVHLKTGTIAVRRGMQNIDYEKIKSDKEWHALWLDPPAHPLPERVGSVEAEASDWRCANCDKPIPRGQELAPDANPDSMPWCGYCLIVNRIPEREGYVSVPLEPTEAMQEAGCIESCDWLYASKEATTAIYKAMLSAAPK